MPACEADLIDILCHSLTAVHCGDPGVVADADRTGKSFKYDDEVVYKCRAGFTPKDHNLGSHSFTRICKDDGWWSAGTTCVGEY